MQSTEKVTDQTLISMCQDGNDFGYTVLYNRYAKGVFNSISRLVVHTAEAEDLLQETFFTVFSEISKLNGINSIEGWIKRIAINRSISHLRKKKIVFADLATTELADNNEYSAEENDIFDCRVEDVKNSIEQLPPGYKTIVNLYLFENMPHEEIAGMLGISHSTVRTQYHRAKKKILSQLKDKSYYD
jgi:RNA polymerase sigma factor (sigma-70 family)